MSRLSRRSFLASAAVTIAGTKSSPRVFGANETINMAVAGLNGRGGDLIKEFAALPGVRVSHLIDPDTRVFAKRVAQLQGLNVPPAVTLQDVRRALDDKSVDALAVAAPNHWHALMTVWACQAGKDVYVEKPCSHAVREGRAAVSAARKFNRVVQHGTQRRSWPEYRQLAAVVRSGVFGPLRVARGIVYKLRLPIGTRPTAPAPEGLDFDLWLGPAAARPFHANLVHYNWHWFWDFGNGDVGNQGVHQMDLARWMIPGAMLPKRVVSVGGRFGEPDQGETPNTLVTQFDFDAAQLIFEVRGLPTTNYRGDAKNEGLVLHFDDGEVVNFRFFRRGRSTGEPIPQVLPEPPRPPGGSHFGNFIAAVRSRDRSQQSADILEGHYSSALCHLANASYRVGVEAAATGTTGLGDLSPEARATWAGAEQHLAQCLGARLADARLRVGRTLMIDADSEAVLGDAQADAELSATYRKPFSIEL